MKNWVLKLKKAVVTVETKADKRIDQFANQNEFLKMLIFQVPIRPKSDLQIPHLVS